MSAFDLQESMKRAEARLGAAPGRRRQRSDRGQSRLAPEVLAELQASLQGQERPSVGAILERLRAFSAERGLRAPSRAAVYQLMTRLPATSYPVATLPEAVRETLYNLDPATNVPGHQLAFHCFNYGSTSAVSFAAGLPWLALYQAVRMRGWRSRSRGLLAAVLAVRGI